MKLHLADVYTKEFYCQEYKNKLQSCILCTQCLQFRTFGVKVKKIKWKKFSKEIDSESCLNEKNVSKFAEDGFSSFYLIIRKIRTIDENSNETFVNFFSMLLLNT